MDYFNYRPTFEYYPEQDTDVSDNMEVENLGFQYGEINKLADIDMIPVPEAKMEDPVEEITTELNAVITDGKKKKNKYGPEQIRIFIDTMQEEGMTVPKAAKQCLIPQSSVYVLFNEFNASDGTVLPGSSSKKRNRETPQKNFPEHTLFLIKYFDDHPSATLGLAREALVTQFADFTISLPAKWKHLTEECFFSLKQASKYNLDRDSERTIRLRDEIVSKWKENGVNFQKNCVSIDEAGFNTQMIRRTNVKVYNRRGVNLSVVGCISPFGIINFSKVEPLKPSDAEKIEKGFQQPKSKKRKAETEEKAKPKPTKKGTTAYHIVKFVEIVMDVLDRHNKKDFFIVMDNAGFITVHLLWML